LRIIPVTTKPYSPIDSFGTTVAFLEIQSPTKKQHISQGGTDHEKEKGEIF
jgi:hypothetical protein